MALACSTVSVCGIEGRIVKTHPLSQSFNHPDELIHREWIEFSAIALASKAC